MGLNNILNEALNKEVDPNTSTLAKVKVPQLEVPKWKANWTDRTKKFEKVPDHFVSLAPAEGYFFAYNPEKNAAFESNASFAFIVGQYPQKNRGNSRWDYASNYHDLKDNTYRPNDLGDNYHRVDFLVSDRQKKVFLEKNTSGGSTGRNIVNGVIKEPDTVNAALEALVHHHPEVKNYLFIPSKNKVSEYLTSGIGALGSGGSVPAYFATHGEEMKVILEKGLDDKSISMKGTKGYNNEQKVTIYLQKKEALSDAKNKRSHDRLHHVWAVAEFPVTSKELLDKQYGRYTIAADQTVPPGDIKLIKTNEPDFFEEGWEPAKDLKDSIDKRLLERGTRWKNIFVARSQEEWDKFNAQRRKEDRSSKTGSLKRGASSTIWRYRESNSPIGLTLKSGPDVLMFRPGSTKKDIGRHFAAQWFKSANIDDLVPYRKEEGGGSTFTTDDDKADIAYDIFFKGKFPDYMKPIIIMDAFGKVEGQYRRYAIPLARALGWEIKE